MFFARCEVCCGNRISLLFLRQNISCVPILKGLGMVTNFYTLSEKCDKKLSVRCDTSEILDASHIYSVRAGSIIRRPSYYSFFYILCSNVGHLSSISLLNGTLSRCSSPLDGTSFAKKSTNNLMIRLCYRAIFPKKFWNHSLRLDLFNIWQYVPQITEISSTQELARSRCQRPTCFTSRPASNRNTNFNENIWARLRKISLKKVIFDLFKIYRFHFIRFGTKHGVGISKEVDKVYA